MQLRLDPFSPNGVSVVQPPEIIWESGGGTTTASSDSRSIVTTSTVITATSGHIVVDCDATLGDITISLPTAVGNSAVYSIRKSDSSANEVIVEPDGSETINGDTELTIQFQNSAARIQSNGIGLIVT